ncbi:PROTEIN NEDD1 [Salix purpurea]|uniref:PROTEIN NEDD1 n=1 Tax=Salix purpurea TaxID=77065 RepID=A0A9Q0TUF9_SALPP|nr:PROTEIN NEDD1 [Salix purpurea]
MGGAWGQSRFLGRIEGTASRNLYQLLALVTRDLDIYALEEAVKYPKVSWLNQHSAPTVGIVFSPSNDKIIATGTSSGRVVFYDVRGKPQAFHCYSCLWKFRDPLPSVTSSSVALSTSVSGYGNTGRSGLSIESTSLTATTSGLTSTMSSMTLAEETLPRSHLWPGTLMKLNPNSSYNFKDEMEVFSPLVEFQPIIPLLDKFWDDHEGAIYL